MKKQSKNHLKSIRLNVHHLVETMHALIRKVTPTSDFLIINNFNKAKNDITA